ncbi:Uncharacterised protein [Legionella sainthelensi]|uniref:hypothetical protein n=1 Tax=Legionella sainthelensi TaxID=28087 RepID=UPI000F6D5CE6|nr:hypothetical protein [Legionella sainthelensi]VEB38819.1 Uncharacterised protein [Legionella sainthelensi]
MIHKEKRYFLILMLIPIALICYFSFVWRNFQLDDALIYLRYIKNFQEGYGLVYNIGEKFNGLTSFLYTFFMMGASYFIKNLQLANITISALFMCVTAVFSATIFSKNSWEKLFTAICISVFPYFYTTLGMETSLFLMLISISLYLYKIDSDYFLITLAFLVITRNEGVFLAAPLIIDYMIRNKRLPNIRIIFISSIIFISPYAFNYFYYGGFFPVTGGVKIAQGKSIFWGTGWNFFDVNSMIDGTFSNSKLLEYSFLLFLFYGLFILIRNRLALLLLIFEALLLIFYGGLNIPNYHWYYAPFFLISIIFACRGVGQLSSILLSKGFLNDRAYLFIILTTAVILSLVKIAPLKGQVRHENYANIGGWINHNTPANASIGLVEIGTVGWYSERKIIDILGLVNPYNGAYIGKNDIFSWLTHYQPDYILVHDPAWPFEDSATLLQTTGAYQSVSAFDFPGYKLLEKTDKYDNKQIIGLIENRKNNQKPFSQLLRSSSIGAPYVLLDKDGLFAHAPSTLSYILPKQIKSIYVSYGMRPDAEGKHEGVCFEIIREKNNQKLLQKCIDSQETGAQLVKNDLISFDGNKGEKLIFKTLCKKSCNYAWSYWYELSIKKAA